MQSIFEKMGGTYIQSGDYYIPNLELPDDEVRPSLGKYGMLRETFLMEHRKLQYHHLLLNGTLYAHLSEVDQQAQNLLDTMMPQMIKAENVTEELKATNQMEWVGRINSIKIRIEEIIFSEIVYA